VLLQYLQLSRDFCFLGTETPPRRILGDITNSWCRPAAVDPANRTASKKAGAAALAGNQTRICNASSVDSIALVGKSLVRFTVHGSAYEVEAAAATISAPALSICPDGAEISLENQSGAGAVRGIDIAAMLSQHRGRTQLAAFKVSHPRCTSHETQCIPLLLLVLLLLLPLCSATAVFLLLLLFRCRCCYFVVAAVSLLLFCCCFYGAAISFVFGL
jgi:hypothetical protein